MQFLSADPLAATADYRRRARRIRASFSRDPLLRQRALGELAARRNAELQAAIAVTEPVSSARVMSVIERGFADHAAERLQPFGFSFSDRVRLLDAAERLGISRFRANMILAMQEHHAPARRVAAPEGPAKSLAPPLIVILFVEMIVVSALVALCAL